MNLLWWRKKEHPELERAKQLDRQAGEDLEQALAHLSEAERRVIRARQAWPETLENRRRTDKILATNGLTKRFLNELHHGGHA